MRRRVFIPLAALILLHIAVLFAGFLAPYNPTEQYRATPFAPPTRIHVIDQNGTLHFRPFVYALRSPASESYEADGYEEDRTHPYPVRFLAAGPPYKFAGVVFSRVHLFEVDSPATLFLIGTDSYGRDQFSRLLYGAQISLLGGPVAASLSLILGLMLGTIAGYYGGWLGEALLAGTELFLALPWLYLLLAARAALPLDLPPHAAFLAIVCLLGLTGWARPALLVRGLVLTAKEREYVLAARGFGASDGHLLYHHVLPQIRPALLTHASLLIPHYILAEVTMSFLGIGVNEPAASWGLMLGALQTYRGMMSWWVWLPAILLLPVIGLYYWLGNALSRSGYEASMGSQVDLHPLSVFNRRQVGPPRLG